MKSQVSILLKQSKSESLQRCKQSKTCFEIYFLDYLTTPQWEQSDTSGAEISGCRFKFHEDLNSFASYVGYDENQTEISNIKATLTETGEVDTYQFDPITVDSYTNMGSYFKCRLYNPETMPEVVLSSLSANIPVKGKPLKRRCIF